MADILARQRRAACQVSGPEKAKEEEVRRTHNRNIFFDIYCDILFGIYSKILLAILSDMFVIVRVSGCVFLFVVRCGRALWSCAVDVFLWLRTVDVSMCLCGCV